MGKLYKVKLRRRIGEIVSTVTIEQRAEGPDHAVYQVESRMRGWQVQVVVRRTDENEKAKDV